MTDRKTPKSMAGPSRRAVMAGGTALAASLFLPKDLRAADYPTAEVNTTGLAVTDDTVTIGILHSVTGTMAISETGSVQAEKLAIEQINAQGAILGRKQALPASDSLARLTSQNDTTRASCRSS